MKGKSILGIALMCLCIGFTGCTTKEETVSEETKKVPVEVISAEMGEIKNEYTYSGKLTAAEEANLSSMVAGKVEKVNFDIGDTVKAGDVLFTMETGTVSNNLSSAEASLSAAEAAIESAQLAYDNAQLNYDNNKVLYEAGAISKSAFDQIELGLEQAKVSVDSALAQKEAALAQVSTFKKSLSDSVITSPINGVVTGCNVKAGEILNQTSGYPFTIMNMDKMLIKVSVSESIINKIHKDDTVDLKIKSISSDMLEGKVKTVNPAANHSGTYDVEIEIDNASGEIKSGMFAEVYFVNEKAEDMIIIPKEAVLSDGEGSYVYIAVEGKAVKKAVETSVDNGDNIGITDGINKGDLVIVKGQNYVDEGTELNIVSGEE